MVFGVLLFLRGARRSAAKLQLVAEDEAVPVAVAETSAGVAGPAFELLSRAVDRALGPLVPMFVATQADWMQGLSPERAFRAAVLMLVGGFASEASLSAASQDDARVQRFLRLRPPAGALDSDDVVRGVARLAANVNARDALRAVVESAKSQGLLGREGLVENTGLVADWTVG